MTDIPTALDPELISGDALGKCGRSNVEEYMAGKDAVTKVCRVIDGVEHVFYVMRRSLRFMKDDQWMIRVQGQKQQ